ncbi:MAG TPA: phosphatase PAP2 family protein [Candidatus Polarisedimenticolia bacterium]|nr:phosphatase PAP2 family protein [Candidatus Polarisedimenticolia bacterium]
MNSRRAAAALLFAAGIALLLPWARIDPAVSRFFYRPATPSGPWQDAAPLPWGLLAGVTTWVAVALAMTGIGLAVRAWRARPSGPAEPPSMRAALVVLLGLALGPGLLVNVILKDHCHRPRPRQTLGLGGDFTYVAPLRIGPVGKSFPCGHSAVGFACIALAGVVEARRRGARAAIVAGSLALGALLGLGRIATGAHFASDVLWSGILTCATVMLVEAALTRVPARRTTGDPSAPAARTSAPAARTSWVAAGGLLAVAAMGSALLCFPFRHDASPHALAVTAGPATTLEARIEVGHARLVVLPSGEAALTVESHHDGFGVPWGRVDESIRQDGETARYRLAPRGWFADLEGTTILRVPASSVARVAIFVEDGHLTVDDESGGALLPAITCDIRRDALRLRGPVRRDQLEIVER